MKTKFLRKLIPAISTLLVAAVVLSTASYAWFTMNQEARLNGIEMQANASGNLLMAYSLTAQHNVADAWRSTLNMSAETNGNFAGTFLRPASSENGLKFFATSGTGVDAGSGKADDSSIWTTEGTPNWSLNRVVDEKVNNVVGGVPTPLPTAGSEGYYLDIPLSFKTVDGAEAKVVIDLTKTGFTKAGGSTASINLAARFAIINATARTGSQTMATTPLTIAANQFKNEVTAPDVYYLSTVNGPISKDALIGTGVNAGKLVDNTNAPIVDGIKGVNNEASFMNVTGVDIVNNETAILFTIPEGCIVSLTVRVWIEGQSLNTVDANAAAAFNFNIVFKEKA